MQHSAAGLAAIRVLVYTHRWLGIVLGLLFAGWFVSGVVLMYAGMPRLSPAERRARLPELDFEQATVSPASAAGAIGLTADGVALGMVGARPVYRLRGGLDAQSVYADTSAPVAPVSAEVALAEARAFAPEHGATLRYDGRLAEPDQWTLEINRLLPLHRIALGDADDTRLYVTEASGEIVLKTTASSRRWAYPGAILHWIYLTPIRRHGAAWAQFIIWTSVAGTVLCAAGLAWGLWRYSPRRVYRLKRVHAHSPYAGWMWWHHYAGIVFGVVTLTWIFSGLMSMDPWNWHPSTSPTPAQRLAIAGEPFAVESIALSDVRGAIGRVRGAHEATVVLFQRRYWLTSDVGRTPLVERQGSSQRIDEAAIAEAAQSAIPGARAVDVALLGAYDAYYYDRRGELPLPVVRIRYDDPVRTWLYVDADRGVVVRKEERLTRLNRWLYHGLHSLDFPFLYYRRPLWDIVVIALSVGGLALTVVSFVPAWRRLRRRTRGWSARR